VSAKAFALSATEKTVQADGKARTEIAVCIEAMVWTEAFAIPEQVSVGPEMLVVSSWNSYQAACRLRGRQ
jgi:hypothetical protein